MQSDTLRLQVPIFCHLGIVISNGEKISQGDWLDLSYMCMWSSREAGALGLE